MEADDFHSIIDRLENQTGLKLKSMNDSFWRNRLHERMSERHISSEREYCSLLLRSAEEMQSFIEWIVVSETWFFRDREVFDFLTLFAKKGSPIKILSLACSSGEEPYSIGMALFDAGLSEKDFTIDAADISLLALEKAQAGIYRKNSFRGKELSFRDRYFNKTHDVYAIKDKIKKQVRFHHVNLFSEKLPFASHSYHFIFCRNLLIYVTPFAQNQILTKIKSLLLPGGYVAVGPAETQIVYSAGFTPVQFPGTYAFKWEETKERGKAQHIQTALTPQFKEELEDLELKNHLLEEAARLADSGSFNASKELCLKYIDQFGANPDIYYLLGLINQAMGIEEEAEDFFRKTVYLKPSHYEALVCLALISETKGELNQAELFRKRAQKYL